MGAFHLLRLLCLGIAAVSASSVSKFITYTDMHLDPFYGQPGGFKCNTSSPPLGKYGCDSPYALVKASASAGAAVLPNPAFLFYFGDAVRHAASELPKQPPNDLYSTMNNVIGTLAEAFPQLSRKHTGSTSKIVWVLGNNDLLGDYYLEVSTNSTFLRDVAQSLSDELSPEEQATVAWGGYYSRDLSSTLTVLALNTIQYSSKHKPDTTALDDPFGQFQWLEEALAKAKKNSRMVYIVGHIPPAVDTYNYPPLWTDKYIVSYIALVSKYNDIVAGQLFGHVHSEEFRAFPSSTGVKTAIITAGSVTPLFQNSPAFRVVNFEPQAGTLLDYTTYYTLLPKSASGSLSWSPLYSARAYLNLSDLSSASFRTLAENMAKSSTVYDAYIKIRQVGYQGTYSSCDALCRWKFSCCMTTLREVDFQKCVAAFPTADAVAPAAIQAPVLSVAHAQSPCPEGSVFCAMVAPWVGGLPRSRAVLAAAAVAGLLALVTGVILLVVRRRREGKHVEAHSSSAVKLPSDGKFQVTSVVKQVE